MTVDPAWANLADDEAKEDNAPAFVKGLVRPINGQAGDLLKVSDFVKHNTVLYVPYWYECLNTTLLECCSTRCV